MKARKNRRLTARFREALGYATELHDGQTRKGTDEPFVGHLLGVASLVLQYGGSEDEAIGALLHDAVEDQGGRPRLQEIRQKFGKRVAAIVHGCSDSFQVPKPPWSERKKKHLRRIRRSPASVRLVTAADKLHNARAILADYRAVGEPLWSRFKGKKRGTLRYYRRMVQALGAAGSSPLMEELDRVVSEIQHLACAQRRGHPRYRRRNITALSRRPRKFPSIT